VGKTIGDTRRSRVNQKVEDEAARAGAAARTTCDLSTLHGTYLFVDHGVDVTGNKKVPFAGAGYEYFDGNGTIKGILTSNFDGAITPRQSFEGRYTVNPDCTGRSTYPATPETPEYKYDLYIHPEGDMLTWVQIKPEGSEVVSAVEQRVTLKRIGG
jgi:hypothetical protein